MYAVTVVTSSGGPPWGFRSMNHVVDNLPIMPATLLELLTTASSPGASAVLTAHQSTDSDLARLEEALVNWNPDCVYDDWYKVGAALHHESSGLQEGFQVWDRWSSKGKKYKGPDDLRPHWRSFSSQAGKRVVTGGFILQKATASADDFAIVAESDAARAPRHAPILNVVAAAIGADTFRTPPAAPEFLITELLPLEIGGLFGAGGIAKSTLMLIFAIHLVLGRPLWSFPVPRSGSVLVLSAEDGIERMRHRLYYIGQALGLTDDEMEKVGAGLHIEDLTGRNARLVEADERGNLSQTPFVDEVINTYKHAGIVLTVIDPTVYFGPGERYVNDGEAAIAQVAARFRREMACAVALVHHVGKANARAGASDQYVGRGGSALSDGLRWVWTLVAHTKDDGDLKAPAAVPAEAIREGRLLRLHIAKLTDAPRPAEPIWLLRSGFSFERVLQKVDAEQGRRDADMRRVCEFICEQLEQGIRYSVRSLEDEAKRLGIGRNDLRSLIREAQQRGTLIYRDLPESEQRGGLKQFLDPGVDSDDHPDVGLEGAE
jgi:hypothetical protein